MYTDFFLRFDTEAEANAALFTEQTKYQQRNITVGRLVPVDVFGMLMPLLLASALS